MQASPVSGFSVNGSPGLTRAQHGSPGLMKAQQGSPAFPMAQQGSPGLTRVQQGSSALQAKLQGSPGLTSSSTQGSPGDKLTRKGALGEVGSRATGNGSRRGQHQRWVFIHSNHWNPKVTFIGILKEMRSGILWNKLLQKTTQWYLYFHSSISSNVVVFPTT